jgi:hypothetical protein
VKDCGSIVAILGAVFCLATFASAARPGSGIVVDEQGNYCPAGFVDPGFACGESENSRTA